MNNIKITPKLLRRRIKEMEELNKQGKLCGAGTLGLVMLKLMLKNLVKNNI